jgi:hypothetical protein
VGEVAAVYLGGAQHHKDDQLRPVTDTENCNEPANSSAPAVVPRPASSAILEGLPKSNKTAEQEDDVLS